MKLGTSLQSAIKYPNLILLWPNEVLELQRTTDQDVEWCVDNKVQAVYSTTSIRQAFQNKLYSTYPSKRSNFIAIDKNDIVIAQPTTGKLTLQAVARYIMQNDPRFANAHIKTLASRLSYAQKRLNVKFNSWQDVKNFIADGVTVKVTVDSLL